MGRTRPIVAEIDEGYRYGLADYNEAFKLCQSLLRNCPPSVSLMCVVNDILNIGREGAD